MGYYVNTEDINILVPKDFLEPAYKAVLAMNDYDSSLKRGGSYGPNAERKYWFSWMPEDLSKLADLQAVLLNLGFEDTEYNERGDLVLGCYNNKSGQEDLFLEAIAPFVEEGSYAIWKGEDDTFWKWEFNDGKMLVIPGDREIVWLPENAYTPTESHSQTAAMIAKLTADMKKEQAEEDANA